MTSLIDEERFLLLRDVMEASLVAVVDGDCDDDLLLPTAASIDSGMMDNGRNMVETNEVAMTRAIVATDFIMLLYFFVVLEEVLLLEVEVVEEGRRRSSDGRKEMPNILIVDASLNDLMVMWKGGRGSISRLIP